MAEYVKREYAIDAVLDVYYDTPDIDLSGEKFEAAINGIPAADIAPVRRCKDCANSYEDAFGRVCAYGICVDRTVPDDFYCASNKPKEGAE